MPVTPPYRLEQLLARGAELRPEAPAVRASDGAMTYAELDHAADRIAAALVGLGVSIGDRVGVHLPKGVRAVASLYGIMRAGAAYVPIDPASPAGRAAYIATDAAISALISDASRITGLTAQDPAAAPSGICTDGEVDGFIAWEDVMASPGLAADLPVVETDLAYILYTSGSTGRPKGVAISHRNSLSFVLWAAGRLGLHGSDVLSNHAPLHFDLSTLDLYCAAAVGAEVCVVPAEAAMFPVRLVDWMAETGITVWYSVPSALTMMVRYGRLDGRDLGRLRLILFAGEVFPVRYLRELMRLVPHAGYFNLYGPTETNVCTYEEVLAAPAADDPPVSIGRACENCRGRVLDEAGQELTEVGAEGELFIDGPNVAQGYWGDPERTAAGFVAPATYRTGDSVVILDDGPRPRYRFVGRRDHLVKTRGYRVELGEVEAAIYRHPGVGEGVVVAVPDELMGNRLVAFATARNGHPVSEADLRAHCRAELPGYMVPDRTFVVDDLPRTSNDKFDRRALTERAAGHYAEEASR